MNNDKKLIKQLTLALSLAVLLAVGPGCQENANQKEANSSTLVISGSTSMEEVNNALADAYRDEHPEISVRVQALGSSEGIQAALEGVADIGASSRALSSDEKEAAPELREILVARDGIAVIVNPVNPVGELERDQISKIYRGEIRNWQEVGGPDHEITVIRREDGSGTLGAFCELALGEKEKDAVFWRLAIIQNSTGAILNTVGSDPHAIGFVSMAVLDERVKALSVDGVEPEVDNIMNGSYTLQRPYLFIIKGEPGENARDFIEYALSPAGQQVVAGAHAIPVQ